MSDPTDTLTPGFEPCDGARNTPAPRAARDVLAIADEVERIAAAYDLPADADLLLTAAAEMRRSVRSSCQSNSNTAQIGHNGEEANMTITETTYVPQAPSPEVAASLAEMRALASSLIPTLVEHREVFHRHCEALMAEGHGDQVYVEMGVDPLHDLLAAFAAATDPSEHPSADDLLRRAGLEPASGATIEPTVNETPADELRALPEWFNPSTLPDGLAERLAAARARVVATGRAAAEAATQARAVYDEMKDSVVGQLPDGAYESVSAALGGEDLWDTMSAVSEATWPDVRDTRISGEPNGDRYRARLEGLLGVSLDPNR